MQDVIIVTGGSRGIGAATAILAARRGCRVAVTFLREGSHAENVVAQIAAAGGTALAVRADVAREEDVLQLFDIVESKLGRVNRLVNSPGIAGSFGPVRDLDAVDIQNVLSTNIAGTLLCCREAVRRMSG